MVFGLAVYRYEIFDNIQEKNIKIRFLLVYEFSCVMHNVYKQKSADVGEFWFGGFWCFEKSKIYNSNIIKRRFEYLILQLYILIYIFFRSRTIIWSRN